MHTNCDNMFNIHLKKKVFYVFNLNIVRHKLKFLDFITFYIESSMTYIQDRLSRPLTVDFIELYKNYLASKALIILKAHLFVRTIQ